MEQRKTRQTILKRAGKALNITALMASPPRVQYGALPWRMVDGTLEVMLLTSRGTRRWVIPKGWPHDSLSSAGSAAQEAWEEAGLRGPVSETPIGSYHYDKVRDEGGSVPCIVYVHSLEVAEQCSDWPEKDQRECEWFPRQTAARQVHEEELHDLILSFAPSLPYT